MDKSPAEVLGAIIDEVEGLRRTDSRSYLPERILRDARMALDVGAGSLAGGSQLDSIDGLVGRTVSHVFDGDLRRAEIVIVCSDGAYVALEIDGYGDDSHIYVDSKNFYGRKKDGLSAYLKPPELVEVGLMTKAEQQRADRDEQAEKLKTLLKRHEQQAEFAKRELAKLEGTTQ